jgi:hypothetical protein
MQSNKTNETHSEENVARILDFDILSQDAIEKAAH